MAGEKRRVNNGRHYEILSQDLTMATTHENNFEVCGGVMVVEV